MKVRPILLAVATGLALATSAGVASATTVYWADLTKTEADGALVSGSINAPTGVVGVTLSSSQPVAFAQVNDGGTNYWTGPSYSYNGSYNQPATSDIVALNVANTETITFSAPVTDLYFALNSWNGASATLDHAFTVVSEGCGYWGCGSFVPDASNTSFSGQGDAVGILQIPGTITSLTITDSVDEYWHGMTVGIGGIAPPTGAAPEPSAWALMIGGVGLIGAALRLRRKRGAIVTT